MSNIYPESSGAKAIADKYIARNGRASSPNAVVWAPVRISDKEREWLAKAILRGGYIPTRERDGESAPFLSELRSMNERGLVRGMPWRITKFGRDCYRELEAQQVSARAPEEPEPAPPGIVENPVSPQPVRKLAEVERELIAAAMLQCHDNKTHAAKVLGISVRTIRNKLRMSRP